ncbi:unnamed protein product [Ectocarpus sp. 12 AP-2014]
MPCDPADFTGNKGNRQYSEHEKTRLFRLCQTVAPARPALFDRISSGLLRCSMYLFVHLQSSRVTKEWGFELLLFCVRAFLLRCVLTFLVVARRAQASLHRQRCQGRSVVHT